jgi:hypothetical protein
MISDHKKRQVVRPAFELINEWGEEITSLQDRL